MATYQGSLGLKLYHSTASAMSSKVQIDGITDTPDKGGEPESISLNIISEKIVRNIPGQQDIGTMAYTFVPDFTASTGNVAVIQAAIQSSLTSDLWFYEEYVESDGTNLGAGTLYKGKVKSMMIGAQSGNSAQSGNFYVQLTGKSIYVSSGGATPTYTDLFTGASVSTPE